MQRPVHQFSDWGPVFVYRERRQGHGTMDESHTGTRFPDICIILSFAPARNKTRCNT